MEDDEEWRSPKYKNWLRAAKSLECLQEGLKSFVANKVVNHRDQVLMTLTVSITPGSAITCNSCTLENLLPEHAVFCHPCTRRTCFQQEYRHCFGSNPRGRRACPNGICGNFYDKIIEAHVFNDPFWKNTDPSTWCTDPAGWSYAKCFQTTRNSGTCSSETDASGLLSIILNDQNFQSDIECILTTSPNVFTSARILRNDLLLCAKMQLEEANLQSHIAIFIAVLKDQKCLLNDPKAIQSVKKLEKIRDNQTTISLGEEINFLQVRKDGLQCLEQLAKEEKEMRKKIEENKQAALKEIEEVKSEALEIIYADYNLSRLQATQKAIEQLTAEVQHLKKKSSSRGAEIGDRGPFYSIYNSNHKAQSNESKNKGGGPSNDDCKFESRWIKLKEEHINVMEKNYVEIVGHGSYGIVYKSKVEEDKRVFGIEVVVKKIDRIKYDDTAIRREKLASRIMHPFILPLLAVGEKYYGLDRNPDVWFVSPYCKRGDLNTAIKENTVMDSTIRLRILAQIASAIQYLHTAVANVRESILHKDIASKNIVLDSNFNARLIDFGLARENTDDTQTKTGRQYYAHPDLGMGKDTTEDWDRFAFGVVIREMLTSHPPEGKQNSKFLKNLKKLEISQNIDNAVWREGEKRKTAELLNGIAENCMQKETMEGFENNVVEKIGRLWRESTCHIKLLDIPEEYDKCHVCMINKLAKHSSMIHKNVANCTQRIKLCIACEKNSFLNPVKCYCGTDLKLDIGDRWGAVLVAGNYLKNAALARALKTDLTELKKLITSRAPHIMGIREDKISMIAPETPGELTNGENNETLWLKMKAELRQFNEDEDVDTLLVYFSCHTEKSQQFECGSVLDCISTPEFETELKKLTKIDKFIIFLDQCYPPMFQLENSIQINACKETEQAMFDSGGSLFTKYLIRGLKAKSEKTCPDSCEDCEAYWKKCDHFISAESLSKYLQTHIKDRSRTPMYRQGSKWSEGCGIGFFTNEEVKIDFSLKDDDKQNIVKLVTLQYFSTMRELKDKLLEVFEKDKNKQTVQISKDTYRKDERYKVCNSLDAVMSAWILKQELSVKFQDCDPQQETCNMEVLLYKRE